MELTNELKARFFALYWGQQVAVVPMYDEDRFDRYEYEITVYKGVISIIDHLELRPLSSITEEQFKTMVRKNYPKDVDQIFFDRQFICDLFEDKEPLEHDSLRIGMVIFDVDYLRSISIALPFMGIPVSQWVEWGVVKLKTA